MTAIINKTFGITIHGLGDPTSNLPLRFTVEESRTVTGVGLYTPLLTSWPNEVSTDIDPLDGSLAQGSMSWDIGDIDRGVLHGDHARDFLLVSRPEPQMILAATIAAGATILDVHLIAGGTMVAALEMIYLEREVMRVTAVLLGAGVGGSDRLIVERGRFDTDDVMHVASDVSDRLIYTSNLSVGSGNPIVQGREVTAYVLDYLLDTEVVAFRGLLESPHEEQGIISCSARDAWAYVGEKELGQDQNQMRAVFVSKGRGNDVAIRGGYGISNINNDPLLINGDTMVIESEGCVIAASVVLGDRGTGRKTIHLLATPQGATAVGYYQPIYSTVCENRDDPALSDTGSQWKSAYEVLVTDADSGVSHFANDSIGTPSDHPFDIIRNIWASTGDALWTGGGRTVGSNGDYDWLPKPWGLAIPDALIDHTGIDALKISDLFEGVRVRNLILGAGGERVNAVELIGKILTAIMCFPALTPAGLITIKTIRDPGRGNADATITEGLIWVDPGNNEPHVFHRQASFPIVRRLLVDMGRRGTSDEFATQITEADFQDRQFKRYSSLAADVSIDAGMYGDPDGEGGSIESGYLVEFFNRRWLLQTDPLPEFEVKVTAEADFLNAGAIIDLTHPSLLPNDLQGRGITSHRCLLLESARVLEDFTQTWRMLDLFPLTKADNIIAPAWKIESVTNNTTFVLAAAEYSPDDDTGSGAVVVPGRYELWDIKLARRSTTFATLTSYTSGTRTVVLVAPFSDGAPVLPVAGDIMRIAQYDDRSTIWDDEAFIASTTGKLGAANDPAHKWSI